MALLDDVFSGWGTTVLIGVGVALAAPVLLPAAGAIVRPVAKELIKGGLFVVDSVRELLAEGQEQLSDLTAEARAEYTADTSTRAARTGRRTAEK
ncbi:MAG TPA: DUF5132 domain-containing protein [Candidatus Binatia bacterium]|nr:DUF5132 domain-containing protein [Candidatus Binatia bacterium]